MKSPASVFVFLALFASTVTSQAIAADLSDRQVSTYSETILFGVPQEAEAALDKLVERGEPDIIPTLVLASRYRSLGGDITAAMSKLAGQPIGGWKDAMLWQEAHPEVVPHDSYRDLKLEVFRRIDPNFMQFLGGERAQRNNLDIRLEEITWGGVPVDGIPSLDDPKLISVSQATYLLDDDLVFGVEINGDVRAYPLRIMGWHEMFNETIGGVPVALAYCTLCGAGILFETGVEGRDTPLIFGSSGFLYRSNKLMFDRQTNSLWNQFTGEPVSGPLRQSGLKLKIRPVTITSWANWMANHPETKVLSVETGHRRDYGSGVVYNDYFTSPELMFPTIVRDETTVRRKDYVFGIRDFGAAKAWPVEAFNKRRIINDSIGGRNIVLIGDALTRTVRAFERDDQVFTETSGEAAIKGPDGDWTMTEDALIGPDGARLARIAGHVSYWFAWDGYLGIDSELYTDKTDPT